MSAPDFFIKIATPPEGAICDFCSSPDVRWTFPCREHTTQTHAEAIGVRRDGSLAVEALNLDRVASGGWAACPACHALVIRGDRERLATRSTKRMLRKHPEIPFAYNNLLRHVRSLHDAFWSNREGAPVHHDHRPREDPTR